MPDDEKPDTSQQSEKHRLLAKAADIATNVMNESAKAMKDESAKIDAGNYELSHMVATVTKVVNAGIAGATDLARIPLEEKWPEKHLVMGEYISSVLRGMVTQAGVVAADTAKDMDADGKYKPSQFLQSLTRLIDIAVAGGMDIAETLGAGPAQFQPQPSATEFYTVPVDTVPRDPIWKTKPTRDAADDTIDDKKLQFDPKTLLPGATQFRVLVDATGLLSGVYKGVVKVGSHEQPIQIEL
ncbi:hypothetical protein ACIA48_17970 [Mycobacterium sp. NPDC051804]|uniref:hypothetical protein n=1 Tax=Mycobacterium sp. NPDC051804 TaxID=3364295 RepID=UPI0037A3F38B